MFKVLEFVLALITNQIAGPKPTLFRHDLLQLRSSEERLMVVNSTKLMPLLTLRAASLTSPAVPAARFVG